MGLRQLLKDHGDAQNVANVDALVDYAAGKLTLIRETFPDYTLHDRQHAENVIRLMEELLGHDLEKVTPLEAAMLILAAYFHDIGMVYHPNELASLVEEQDFRDFLDQNPSAYVRARPRGAKSTTSWRGRTTARRNSTTAPCYAGSTTACSTTPNGKFASTTGYPSSSHPPGSTRNEDPAEDRSRTWSHRDLTKVTESGR